MYVLVNLCTCILEDISIDDGPTDDVLRPLSSIFGIKCQFIVS